MSERWEMTGPYFHLLFTSVPLLLVHFAYAHSLNNNVNEVNWMKEEETNETRN